MAIVLDTPRLRLRPFVQGDLDAYAAICADAEVMRYIGTGETVSRADAWRQMAIFLGHWALLGYGMWALEEKETGAFVGRVGFLHPPDWPDFELGWTLARAAWGRGYATEAAARALDYAWRELRRARVVSLIRPANERSVRVALRLGAQRAGEVLLRGSPAELYEHRRP